MAVFVDPLFGGLDFRWGILRRQFVIGIFVGVGVIGTLNWGVF
jgi:hypothetical protein